MKTTYKQSAESATDSKRRSAHTHLKRTVVGSIVGYTCTTLIVSILLLTLLPGLATIAVPTAILILSILFGLFIHRTVERTREGHERLLGTLAHALRNPLSTLKMQNEIALHEAQSDILSGLVTDNLAEVDRAIGILENLVLYGRGRSGRGENFERLPLLTILEEVSSRLQHISAQKDVTISLNVPPGHVLFGDPNLLEQLFFNIVRDLVSITKEGGTILLSSDDGSGIRVTIEVPSYAGTVPEYRLTEDGQSEAPTEAEIEQTVTAYILELHTATHTVSTQDDTGAHVVLSFPAQ